MAENGPALALRQHREMFLEVVGVAVEICKGLLALRYKPEVAAEEQKIRISAAELHASLSDDTRLNKPQAWQKEMVDHICGGLCPENGEKYKEIRELLIKRMLLEGWEIEEVGGSITGGGQKSLVFDFTPRKKPVPVEAARG